MNVFVAIRDSDIVTNQINTCNQTSVIMITSSQTSTRTSSTTSTSMHLFYFIIIYLFIYLFIYLLFYYRSSNSQWYRLAILQRVYIPILWCWGVCVHCHPLINYMLLLLLPLLLQKEEEYSI